MKTITQELAASLKYCEIKENEEFNNSIDLFDIASDFPFCNVTANTKHAGRFDVCAVDTCTESGNDIRLDIYAASECDVFSAVAIAKALHVKQHPAKCRAYR